MPTFPRGKLVDTFRESLGLRADVSVETLAYNQIRNWNSVGHMTLVAALETEFDIMLDTDDVLDMSSFDKSIEILRKYGIEFSP